MTEKEQSDCKAASVALKGISVFGLVILLTIPSLLLVAKHNSLAENSAILVFIFSGLFLGFRSWHLQFDAKLLNEVAVKTIDLNNLDSLIFKLFQKKIENKSLEERINSCYKLAKGFLVLIKIHLILYVALVSYLLIFSHEYTN
jgi:hypothetical protein